MNENGVRVIDFEEARKSIQIREWRKFLRTPGGKEYMRFLEEKVDRIDDPEIPSIYRMDSSKKK